MRFFIEITEKIRGFTHTHVVAAENFSEALEKIRENDRDHKNGGDLSIAKKIVIQVIDK